MVSMRVASAQTELAQRWAEPRQQELVSEVVKPAEAVGLRIFDSVRQNHGNDAPGTAPAVSQEEDR